jgi:hypothetical protein
MLHKIFESREIKGWHLKRKQSQATNKIHQNADLTKQFGAAMPFRLSFTDSVAD